MREEDEREVTRLRHVWRSGGSARPLIETLLRLKRMDEAGALARLALGSDQCLDRDALERLLVQAGSPPPGWTEAMLAFSKAPTIEKWDSLMSFTPLSALYQRKRSTVRFLRLIGVEPNILFLCASRDGIVPDAYELIHSGEVEPETVVQRAQEAPPETRGIWLGLAAEAAFARGDHLGTVRLLRLAYAEGADNAGPEMSVQYIRSMATPEVQAILDKAALPR